MFMTDLQLMQIQVDALYRCDADGRLRCVNEPGEPLAPRFFMGRTSQGNLWRFRHDLPDQVAQQLEQLCASEPVVGDFPSAPRNYAAIRAALQEHAPVGAEYRGPAYRVPDDIQPPAGVV